MTDPTAETARALLWRHGLPEDVIDGALALFAQELAGKIRARFDGSIIDDVREQDAALISPENWARTASAVVSSPPPDQTAEERREWYAEAIHDAMEPDLSLVDQEPGLQALFARAAEAAVALADAELAGLHRKLAASERIRENADFRLGQEMARRQLAEKEAARLSADRAAVLNAAAQHLYTALFPAVYDDMGQKAAEGVNRAVSELRRLAAEAQQQPEAPLATDLHALTRQAAAIWGETPTPLPHAVTILTVVAGDVARQARNAAEGRPVDTAELGKEFGNLVLSTLRWMRDAGLDPDDCVRAALEAQQRYAAKHQAPAVPVQPAAADTREETGA